ncbi:MAG: energy-coupling factor ABC transporter ATP-binding protein [Candidatus Baldrarchaeia archaeon]
MPSDQNSNDNIIEACCIEHVYPDGTRAICNLEFYVKKGECVAILGPNGAGKTTLLLHLNGILLPTKGSVIVKGIPVTKRNLPKIRKIVGMVFQNPDDQLFAPTVEQDVAFGPLCQKLPIEEVRRRVEWALKVTGLEEVRHKPPHHLSGGQKKRAAIAGVLAMRPEILVLDEPVAGLDPESKMTILGILKDLKERGGLTLVIATHDVEVAAILADRIYLMKNGSIIAEGEPRRIFSDEELLHMASLYPPKPIRIVRMLRQKGVPIPEDVVPLTDEELADLIANVVISGRR